MRSLASLQREYQYRDSFGRQWVMLIERMPRYCAVLVVFVSQNNATSGADD